MAHIFFKVKTKKNPYFMLLIQNVTRMQKEAKKRFELQCMLENWSPRTLLTKKKKII